MRLIDADDLKDAIQTERKHLIARGQLGAEHILCHYAYRLIDDAPTANAVPLDTKIVVQTYDEEHEEWNNEIMTIQELLESGMCEIYREECKDQYE